MPQIFINNARGVLAESVPSGETTLKLKNVAHLPASLNGEDWFLMTIFNDGSRYGSNVEVVKVTGITDEGSGRCSLTVERGYEGTAIVHAAGEKAEARITAQTLRTILDEARAYADNKINKLIGDAPEALDTLVELAEALDGDPDFASTITSALSKKLDADSYTAADVLAKLLTVDGEGSGLVADTLRGDTPADLRDRSTHTGTQTLDTISDAGSAAARNVEDFDASGSAAQALASAKNYTDTGLAGKADKSILGTAATRDVTISDTDTSSGRLMKVGDYGLGSPGGGVLLSPGDDLNDLTRLGFYSSGSSNTAATILNSPTDQAFGVTVLPVGAWAGNSSFQILKVFNSNKIWQRYANNGSWRNWEELLHTGNTTVDSNGFIKKASPILKLHADRMETEAPAEFERIDTGHYRLTGCNGLRLTDGWHIETPHDKNGNKYFNVEWEQDHEPDAESGVLNEPADVTLTIRCYERVWNPQTGQYDNGDPVDIPAGRWIDLRMNEVRQPESEMPEDHEAPQQPTEPTEPVIPSVVTMAQAKLALLYAGLYEQVEQALADLPEPLKSAALIEWNHRQTLERTHPLVAQIATALELTERQLDELFRDASLR